VKTRWRILAAVSRTAVGIGAVLTFVLALTVPAHAAAEPERLPLPACSTYIKTYRAGPWIVRVPAQNSGGNVECILATGNQGEGVRQLQRSLNVCYRQGLTVDGIFGGNTRAALVRVQTSLRISADGGYGPQTRDAMVHQAQELQTTCGRY
jgi:hypothetical protein